MDVRHKATSFRLGSSTTYMLVLSENQLNILTLWQPTTNSLRSTKPPPPGGQVPRYDVWMIRPPEAMLLLRVRRRFERPTLHTQPKSPPVHVDIVSLLELLAAVPGELPWLLESFQGSMKSR